MYLQVRKTQATLKAQSIAPVGGPAPALSQAIYPEQHEALQAIDRIALNNALACNVLIKMMPSLDSDSLGPIALSLAIKYEFNLLASFPTVGVKTKPSKT
ncbi:MAG: hypothetical protein ACT6RN_27770 [Agrobacterium sp.]|uniref:hypothetical protein n=1 Tax=Agrobacterium sp. TaxID=361 RepID=UPI004037D6C7